MVSSGSWSKSSCRHLAADFSMLQKSSKWSTERNQKQTLKMWQLQKSSDNFNLRDINLWLLGTLQAPSLLPSLLCLCVITLADVVVLDIGVLVWDEGSLESGREGEVSGGTDSFVFRASFPLWIVAPQQNDFKLNKTNAKTRFKDWMSWALHTVQAEAD